MRKTFGFALGLSTLSPTLSLAHEVPAYQSDGPVQPIVVTGQGLAAAPGSPAYGTQEISREQLARTASGRIEDALGKVPGFQQFRRSDSRSSNPSAQGVTLRSLGGNATSRALVLLDGVPMADPFFGYIPFSAIDPNQLASARVTRGGGTGAFGSGAVAGTIELESAGTDQLGLASGGTLVNDRGESELFASIAPKLGQGFAVVSGRWDRGQGFWTTPSTQRDPASARARYESWSIGVRGVTPLGNDLELQVRGLAFDDHRTLRFAGADSFSSGQDASLRIIGRGAWQLDALAYVQARDFGNVVISATNFRKSLDQRRTPSTGYGAKLELRPPLPKAHVVRFGADLRVAQGELQEEAYSTSTGRVTARRRAGGRNADLGFYLEHDWSLGPLVFTMGGRMDRWSIRDGRFVEVTSTGMTRNDSPDRTGWDGSLRGGAVLRLSDTFTVRGAGYSGLRQPTLNELYRPFVVFPVTTRANPALKNETLRGFEIGFDLTAATGVTFSATAFDNRVANAIANVTIIEGSLRERRNVDAVTSRGLELSAKARWQKFGLNGSLAFTDASIEESGVSAKLDGKRPAQTPRLAAYAGVEWHPAERWTLSASVRHIGAQYEDDLEIDRLPSATTLDAYVELPIGPAALVLRGENLLGEEIVTRKVKDSVDLGAPRTIWLGVRYGI